MGEELDEKPRLKGNERIKELLLILLMRLLAISPFAMFNFFSSFSVKHMI